MIIRRVKGWSEQGPEVIRPLGRFAGIGFMVGTLGACGLAQADGTVEEESSEAFVRMINVEVAPIAAQDFEEEIRLTAVATANQDVMVEAEEGGRVLEFFVERGDRVSSGQAIARLDDRILRAQVDQARAAADLAQQTWDRRKRLWEDDQVGSELAYLEAKFAAQQSSSALDALEERLADKVVRAPFSGTFDERHVDVGAAVSPGKTIGRIVDLDPIKVIAGVPERYAADVGVGSAASLVFEALGGASYEAPIGYVASTIDAGNRTFGIEIEVPNSDRTIKPQMVADLSVTRRRVEDAVVVPQDALVRVEDGYVVFVVTEREGVEVAEARAVALGPSRRDSVVIEDGVAVGERLIVTGQKSVADGDRVNVVGGPGGGS